MKKISIVALVLCVAWQGYGLKHWLLPSLGGLSVATVVASPEKYEGREVTVRGVVHLGLESGVIGSEEMEGKEPLFVSGIALDFVGGMEKWINRIHIVGSGEARGLFQRDEDRVFGPMGIYRYRLKGAEISSWPRQVGGVIFVLYHVLPAGLVAVLVCLVASRKGWW